MATDIGNGDCVLVLLLDQLANRKERATVAAAGAHLGQPRADFLFRLRRRRACLEHVRPDLGQQVPGALRGELMHQVLDLGAAQDLGVDLLIKGERLDLALQNRI